MNVLSLFTGIGGIDLGLERAGMTVVGQVEIDPWCRKVLAKHWPEVPRHDDVRTAAGWWGGRPAPDLVAGGFPCQPVSLAGKGLAQADSRWLWPAFAGIIRHLRPRYVLVENVPGLLGRGLGDVLGDLAELGYDAEWDCVSAADVGAPHLRKRVWIIAYPQRQQLRQQSRWLTGASRPGEAEPGNDGSARPLANTSGPRLAKREGQPGDDGTELQAAQRGRVRARDMADAGSSPGRIWTGRRQQLTEGGRGTRHADWWAAEPGMGRVAHGIPARVDRLRGLGNAVVPQVVEHIGRMILDAAA